MFLGRGRHGCLFEGPRLDIHPPEPPRVAMVRVRIHNVQRRPSSMRDDRGIDSTYTALHFVRIRWGRCPTAPFLSLAVVYDVRARRIVGVSSMKQTDDRGWSSRRRRPLWMDARRRARVGDDRSRAMSLAFDEFGRPFIIIKVRARPRRERGGRARARATTTTTTTTTTREIHHPSTRARSMTTTTTTREPVVD